MTRDDIQNAKDEILKQDREAQMKEVICIDRMPHIFRWLETIPRQQSGGKIIQYAFYCQKCLLVRQIEKRIDANPGVKM